MRRTYRSKKDTGGGIDHRDMLLSVDSKSSVFDAYYIQNIKQVKRERSCISSSNPYTAASYKTRKKKYVKRLKEPEPLRESLSESAFLTPDKSIHVNRVPDLFDQLLNSSTNISSPKTVATCNNDLQYLVQPRLTKKMYCRKKLLKGKKKYSNESSDSDKENSISDESDLNNTSNVIAHKLVIEREKSISSPIYLDDSINKMTKKFSILNELNKERSRKSMVGGRFSNIVINVTDSPLLQNSPQCSTPFREKYRGKSIYNFSPILIDKLKKSLKLNSICEYVNNDSTIFSHQNGTDEILDNNTESIVNVTTTELITKVPAIKNIYENEDIEANKISTSNNSVQNEQISSNEISSLHTTELEPFFGFPGCSLTHNSESDTIHLEKNEMGITNNCVAGDGTFKAPVLSQKSICKCEDSTSSDSDLAQSNNNTNLNFGEDIKEMPVNVLDIVESESSYNTCDSDNISDVSLDDFKPKDLVVVMERLSDSVFQKYYERIVDFPVNNLNTSNNSVINDKPGDDVLINSSNSDMNSDKEVSNSQLSKYIDVQIISSSENENSDSNEIEAEDKCLSFVTTRRRNDITNDSFLFNLDNSCTSSSSATFDNTVLSYNRERLEETELLEDNTLVKDSTESVICNENSEIIEQIVSNTHPQTISNDLKEPLKFEIVQSDPDDEVINVNTRKSSRLLSDSMYSEAQGHRDDISSGLKHGIVLKPGKKWERSLSIYRRMTTMGDTFDHSILDDKSMKSKGRKYRQSVISTMEMQEQQGLLHNESVFSRRSTFVSKPRRSTIKIFKDPNVSSISLSSSVLYDDLEGFLNGDCDDTIIELSKLSIGDSGHEVTVLDKFHDTSNRIVTARDYVLRRCNQTEPVLFDECYPDTVLKNCRKIGEGVYGEVFLWRAGDGRVRVMKIVPIAGEIKVNGEDQKDYHEIISEIVIAMELSALRAPISDIERQLDDGKEIDALDLQSVQNATDVFNEVLAIRCVYGAYPSRLLDLWELYDECKGSENDNPAALPADQQYIVLELANAGQDLESYQFANAEQACALFKQIALGLAVAEESLQFEHRDLHWGNVLIAPTDQKYATFVIRGRLYRTARCGVAATLIDYSLSRAARDGRALYNDLAEDDALFDAVGDYQFEVYRLMRDKLGNDWKNFEPYTNILWLHYTVDKMITALRYIRTNTKIHKHYIAKLKDIKNRVLDYGSATQFILTDNEF